MVIDGRRRDDDDMKIGRSLGLSMVISEGLRSRFKNGVKEPVQKNFRNFGVVSIRDVPVRDDDKGRWSVTPT